MWYDILILVILGYATIRGAQKGLIWQLAWIAAIVLCFAFSETLSLKLAPFVESAGVEPPLSRWVAMFLLYLVFAFASFLVARKIGDWIERHRFVEFDRHLGAIFGFIKGVTFCLVLTFFAVTLSTAGRETIMESRSGYAAAIVMDRLHAVMPDELHAVLEPYIHQLDRPGMDLKHAHDHDSDHHAAHDDAPPHRDEGADADERTKRGLLDLIPKLAVPAPGEPEPRADSPTAPDRDRLLTDIAAVYSDHPEARATVVEEIELSLSGLPDRVALGVLEDWRADLLALDPDPDPETSMTTRLDLRILRQLSLAKVPLTTLGSALRERLRDSLPR